MTLVVDASVVAAALVESGPRGEWSAASLRGRRLVAPHMMPAEVTNALRRLVMMREIGPDLAALAHGDVARWNGQLVAYAPFAARVWQLRDTLSAYDAWYVAVAEALGAPLVTLDLRLARAPGPRCEFVVPPEEL